MNFIDSLWSGPCLDRISFTGVCLDPLFGDHMSSVNDVGFNLHMLSFNFKPAAHSLSNTALRCSKCSLGVTTKTMMSSKYMICQFNYKSLRQFSIICWNVSRADVSPNGILSHLQMSSGPTVKTMAVLLFSAITTYQFPGF